VKDTEHAIFLDRDGTLIEDTGYLSDPALVRVLPGVNEALAKLKAAGYLLIVTTNQSGIGRGYYTERDYERVNEAMRSELRVPLDGIYHCPHTPSHGCACRKPAPGMLLRAARDHRIEYVHSWTVGDRERDVMAGLALGCRGVYVGKNPTPPGAHRSRDLAEAAEFILSVRK
jgi:D-glycero-D-manno-heptose 1,7-bisphosphate phosphatase